MSNSALYILTVLIWGSTWLAIKYQLGSVAMEISIAYRFALASLVLLAFCLIRRKNLKFDLRTHMWMASLGAFLFSGNYFFMYWATGHITTGLVSVVFCAMVVINISLSRLFFKTEITRRVLIGASLGMIGICLVFWPEVKTFDLSDEGFFGMVLAFIGTVSASCGNMVSARNQKNGVPVMQANAWGMAYGTIFISIAALVQGHEFGFDPSLEYVSSLVYLAVFGSVIAFGCYLTLLGNIGADKAVYSVVLFPLVALSLSTVFENYHWPVEAIIGVPLVLWGNVLVLSKAGNSRLLRLAKARS
ncbi:Membrane protein [Candidatus Terasakiella magnetica]|uniref:Membrane protein n=1 Tax=Candidatus Terasakiella magnetica TaxID=1867952 RepID=A0A1C3RIK2_9PROT|nr:EamA family transporter [Candidatus Terasakiella magnetica]SCA57102.1 Membrane protein [Candidatus Terasakiella magnetica]